MKNLYYKDVSEVFGREVDIALGDTCIVNWCGLKIGRTLKFADIADAFTITKGAQPDLFVCKKKDSQQTSSIEVIPPTNYMVELPQVKSRDLVLFLKGTLKAEPGHIRLWVNCSGGGEVDTPITLSETLENINPSSLSQKMDYDTHSVISYVDARDARSFTLSIDFKIGNSPDAKKPWWQMIK